MGMLLSFIQGAILRNPCAVIIADASVSSYGLGWSIPKMFNWDLKTKSLHSSEYCRTCNYWIPITLNPNSEHIVISHWKDPMRSTNGRDHTLYLQVILSVFCLDQIQIAEGLECSCTYFFVCPRRCNKYRPAQYFCFQNQITYFSDISPSCFWIMYRKYFLVCPNRWFG